MAQFPEGVEAFLDEALEDGTNSIDDGSVVSEARDAHRERFPRYVPPHQRGHVSEEGDAFVNFRDRDPSKGDDPDRVEGADNDKYQRLKLNINFAIGFNLIKKILRPQFPGVFFHCSGNMNHDHPISHVVTQVGTRFLQRKIHPGAAVLDVYGNPNASERFNRSQANANRPKAMTSLVSKSCDSDFIREVNKWGPVIDDDGAPRYINKTLIQAIEQGDCDDFDTFQMIHTLYYVDFNTVKRMLQTRSVAGKTKKLLALVHRHDGERGSLNNGEQTFVTKQTGFGEWLVKQVNVKTNSAYIHPNLTPFLFAEKKTWYPDTMMDFRVNNKEKQGDGVGLTWECHLVNDDTWIIEMVLCSPRDGDTPDYEEMWSEHTVFDDDPLSSSTHVDTPPDRIWENRLEWLPALGSDREFIHLDLVSKPLFDKLRLSAAGKARGDKKMFAELMREAKHMTSPSALFGDKDGMRCPPEKIVDHVIAAILVDYNKEGKLLDGMAAIKGQLREHARKLHIGGNLSNLSFNNLFHAIRTAIGVARDVNRVVRHSDPFDAGAGALDKWLSDD